MQPDVKPDDDEIKDASPISAVAPEEVHQEPEPPTEAIPVPGSSGMMPQQTLETMMQAMNLKLSWEMQNTQQQFQQQQLEMQRQMQLQMQRQMMSVFQGPFMGFGGMGVQGTGMQGPRGPGGWSCG